MVTQFLKYSTAGGVAAAVHFGILVILVEAFAVLPLVASGIGFVIACVCNYTMQYYWTFSATSKHAATLVRYSGVTLAMLGVNLTIFWVLNEQLGIFYFLSQVVATGIVVVFNFAINRHWTFVVEPPLD